MSNKVQLSAGEAFDDFNGNAVGEGHLVFQSSAGNRLVFNDPASYNLYRLGNPGQFAGTPDSGGTDNADSE